MNIRKTHQNSAHKLHFTVRLRARFDPQPHVTKCRTVSPGVIQYRQMSTDCHTMSPPMHTMSRICHASATPQTAPAKPHRRCVHLVHRVHYANGRNRIGSRPRPDGITKRRRRKWYLPKAKSGVSWLKPDEARYHVNNTGLRKTPQSGRMIRVLVQVCVPVKRYHTG
jgi:hypothetical protein